jgi:hypothetical protein
MFKLKRMIGGISLGKVYEGARGIGYRIGILKNKTFAENLQSLPTLPKEGEDWYPKKEEEIEKARLLKDKYKGETALYLKKP